MSVKYVLAVAFVAAFAGSALAAEFFVAQNAKDKKCTVEEKKPDEKTMMMVGKTSHKTKEEAEKAMKAAAECKK